MPRRNAETQPTLAIRIVSGRPPQRLVGTYAKPSEPPRISTTKTASVTTHSGSSQPRQLRGQALNNVVAVSTVTATAGRHWSSYG